jgi:ribulose-phosphate 3-epimerase
MSAAVVGTEASKPKAVICPSMLSSDFSKLFEESVRMIESGADWLHMDVMDGHFVPNLTLGAPIIKCLRKNLPDAFLDCHLMVTDPMKWVDDFAAAGASQFTFHIEAVEDARAVADAVKAKGMRCGIAIKPGTLLQADDSEKKDTAEMQFLRENISMIDMILVMTVEPGFGGQSFMADMMPKVTYLRETFPSLDIQVDGGVNVDSIDECAAAGANVIVSGSGVFKFKGGVKEAIEILRKSVDSK